MSSPQQKDDPVMTITNFNNIGDFECIYKTKSREIYQGLTKLPSQKRRTRVAIKIFLDSVDFGETKVCEMIKEQPHKNLVKIIDISIIEKENNLVDAIVMEHGFTCTSNIVKTSIKDFFDDVVRGTKYLYEKFNLVHLDLKLPNILYKVTNKRKNKLKFMIADYGLCDNPEGYLSDMFNENPNYYLYPKPAASWKHANLRNFDVYCFTLAILILEIFLTRQEFRSHVMKRYNDLDLEYNIRNMDAPQQYKDRALICLHTIV